MRSREERKGGRGARKIKIEGRDELVRRMEVKKIKGWCKRERKRGTNGRKDRIEVQE